MATRQHPFQSGVQSGRRAKGPAGPAALKIRLREGMGGGVHSQGDTKPRTLQRGIGEAALQKGVTEEARGRQAQGGPTCVTGLSLGLPMPPLTGAPRSALTALPPLACTQYPGRLRRGFTVGYRIPRDASRALRNAFAPDRSSGVFKPF